MNKSEYFNSLERRINKERYLVKITENANYLFKICAKSLD